MNLKEIRTAFVTKNGRYDLVVDTTNYVDNGADFFIQAGQRWLDSNAPHRKSIERYVTDIEAGQSRVILKNVRSIDQVWIKASSEGRVELDRKPYSWLIDQYSDDFGEYAKGIMELSGAPTDADTFTIGSETYTFKTAMTSGITNLVLVGSDINTTAKNIVKTVNQKSTSVRAFNLGLHSTGTDAYVKVLFEAQVLGTDDNSTVFTESADNLTIDGSGTLGSTVAGRASGVGTGTPAYFSPLTGTTTQDIRSPLHTTAYPLEEEGSLGSLEGHDLIFGSDRWSYDGIVFAPSSDKAYTVTIFHESLSIMENDYDVSYYSDRYPELLLMASNMALEIFYRNTSGFKDWLGSINEFLRGIDHDLVREEGVFAGNQLRG